MVTAVGWTLDTSTFIHALIVERVHLLAHLRAPIAFVEYVYRVELVGAAAHDETRKAASREVGRGAIRVERLTTADITRMSAFSVPRRVDIGELATAVLVERLGVGMLCDDHKAVKWLSVNVPGVRRWESIEHVMLAAAEASMISEHDLPLIERRLAAEKYTCRFNLQTAYAQMWFERQQARAAGPLARTRPGDEEDR